MSKWVGETEKNLSRIFERMSGLRGVILIDEADSLLGKRVAVKEGRDATANLLVSHLLGLLEYHEGLVILTTNLRANIDDAYIRRFAAVIEFTRPDVALRRKLWHDALAGLPLSTGVEELAGLAAKVDLSGAEIRNIAMLAAAIAADQRRAVSPADLARAAMREKTKTTLTFSRRDLRTLEPFVEDEP
jgi:SpoVK/Ycf46/Vps4 family AAA+-type ATPase